MYRIRLSTLRMKTCAALNGAAESTVPDTLAVLGIGETWGGTGLAAAHIVTTNSAHAAPKLAISLPIHSSLKYVMNFDSSKKRLARERETAKVRAAMGFFMGSPSWTKRYHCLRRSSKNC